MLLAGFLLAGIGIGFAETESTLVAHLLPDRLRGNGFGVLGLVQSLGDLAYSLVVGLLWVSRAVGFALRRRLDARGCPGPPQAAARHVRVVLERIAPRRSCRRPTA